METSPPTPWPRHALHRLILGTGREVSGCLALLLVTLALTVLLAGCSKKHRIEIWNNTPDRIVIITSNERVTIGPHQMGSFEKYLEEKGSFDICVGTAKTNTFIFISPDASYQMETLSSFLFQLQLNTNGLIYALPPPKRGFRNDIPEQPDGYPLKPR